MDHLGSHFLSQSTISKPSTNEYITFLVSLLPLHFCEGTKAFGTSHKKSFIFTMFSQNKEVPFLDKWPLRNTAFPCHCKTGFKIIIFTKQKSASDGATMPSNPGAELHSCIAQQGVGKIIQYVIFCPTGTK